LLDAHRRWQGVDADAGRVKDTDDISIQEPDFAVGRLGDRRPETLKDGNRADAISNVKRGFLDRALGVGGPCGKLASGNTQEPAARVEPVGRNIVFDNPVDGIAGQSVRRGEGRDSSVRYT